MAPSFLITLREGLEAALIVGIVLAYLKKTGHSDKHGVVWIGVALSVVMSVLVGATVFLTAGEMSGRTEELFEGAAMLAAAGVLTYMIFWMRRQAISIRHNLQAQVHTALQSGSTFALGLLAFVAVGREGVETALFLFAATKAATPAAASIGSLLGLAAATVLGYLLYQGTYRLNLRAFFNVTSILLLLVAAGLLAHGVHEFTEAGVIAPVVEHIWDINWLLDERSTLGGFLKALVGYNGNPSLVEMLAYGAYLGLVGWGYFRPPSERELRPLAERAQA